MRCWTGTTWAMTPPGVSTSASSSLALVCAPLCLVCFLRCLTPWFLSAERPIKNYEKLTDIMGTWDPDTASSIILKKNPAKAKLNMVVSNHQPTPPLARNAALSTHLFFCPERCGRVPEHVWGHVLPDAKKDQVDQALLFPQNVRALPLQGHQVLPGEVPLLLEGVRGLRALCSEAKEAPFQVLLRPPPPTEVGEGQQPLLQSLLLR